MNASTAKSSQRASSRIGEDGHPLDGQGRASPGSSAADHGPRAVPEAAATPFGSIHSLEDVADAHLAVGEPEYFADLHLNDIVGSITAGREAYDLKPFFHGSGR